MRSLFKLLMYASILASVLWATGYWRVIASILPSRSIDDLPHQLQVSPVPIISERRYSMFGGGCAVDVWKLGSNVAKKIEEQGFDFLQTLEFPYADPSVSWTTENGYGLISAINGSQACGFADSSRDYGGYSGAYEWVRSRKGTDPSEYLVLGSPRSEVTYVISRKRAAVMRVAYDG